MKHPLFDIELVARAQEELRRLESTGELDAIRAAHRDMVASGLLELGPKIADEARRWRKSLMEMGLLAPTPPSPEVSECPEHPAIVQLRTRIHGRVPPNEESRLLESARKLLADPRTLIPSTDLKSFNLPSKTIWKVFKHIRGKRPLPYPRKELLKFVVDDYWPRGCPRSYPQTGSRSLQTTEGHPQTKSVELQTKRP